MVRIFAATIVLAALLSSALGQTPLFLGSKGPMDLRDKDLQYAEGSCERPTCNKTAYDRLFHARREARFFCGLSGAFMSKDEREALTGLCRQVRSTLDFYADTLIDTVFRGPPATVTDKQ